MKEKIKIVHFITGLNTGGAEMMLSKLLSKTDRSRFSPVVVSLLPASTKISETIMNMGIPVYSLCMRRRFLTMNTIYKLWKVTNEIKPDILQGWMYHGNLASYLAKKMIRKDIPIVWNVRQSLYDLSKEKKLTQIVINLNINQSHKIDTIVYNSSISMEQHEAIGYAAAKSTMIANGFNIEQFKFIRDAKAKLRQELNMVSDSFLIGMIARYHSMKDHATFIDAAKHLKQLLPEEKICFVLVGTDISWENETIANQIKDNSLQEDFYLLGERLDIPDVLSALDAVSLSSSSESFPNAIGEAMACERICVATNVGDCASIIGDTGIIVPSKDPKALASAWKRVFEMDHQQRDQLGKMARQRIIDTYSMEKITQQYEHMYINLIK